MSVFVYACDVPIEFDEVRLTGKTVFDPGTQEYKIIIDPDTPALIGEDGMRFLIAHECAHVELGHILEIDKASKLMPRLELNKKINQVEFEADCHAVKKLLENEDEEAINAGLEFISFAESAITPTGRHSSYWRVFNIKNCMAKIKE